MAKTNLHQVVTYVTGPIKRQLERLRVGMRPAPSESALVRAIIEQHLEEAPKRNAS